MLVVLVKYLDLLLVNWSFLYSGLLVAIFFIALFGSIAFIGLLLDFKHEDSVNPTLYTFIGILIPIVFGILHSLYYFVSGWLYYILKYSDILGFIILAILILPRRHVFFTKIFIFITYWLSIITVNMIIMLEFMAFHRSLCVGLLMSVIIVTIIYAFIKSLIFDS